MPVLVTQLAHPIRLDARVDDRSLDAGGELPIDALQSIGHRVVETEALLQSFGEKSETAGDEQRLGADLAEAGEHALRAGGKREPFRVDALERGNVEAGEQSHAPNEAFSEVDLAAHRRGGDGGDLRLQSLHVGDFVDALDGDERGIHVHRHQPYAIEALAGRNKGEVEALLGAKSRGAGPLAGPFEAKCLGAATRHADDARSAGSPRQLLQRWRRNFRRLDHQRENQGVHSEALTVSIPVSKSTSATQRKTLESATIQSPLAVLGATLSIAPCGLLGSAAAAYYSKSISPPEGACHVPAPGRYRPRFCTGIQRRHDPLPRVARRQLGSPVFAPRGLHSRLHDRARPHRETEG